MVSIAEEASPLPCTAVYISVLLLSSHLAKRKLDEHLDPDYFPTRSVYTTLFVILIFSPKPARRQTLHDE